MQGEDKHWGMAHDLMPLLTTVLSVKLSWPTSGISSAANQYIYTCWRTDRIRRHRWSGAHGNPYLLVVWWMHVLNCAHVRTFCYLLLPIFKPWRVNHRTWFSSVLQPGINLPENSDAQVNLLNVLRLMVSSCSALFSRQVFLSTKGKTVFIGKSNRLEKVWFTTLHPRTITKIIFSTFNYETR